MCFPPNSQHAVVKCQDTDPLATTRGMTHTNPRYRQNLQNSAARYPFTQGRIQKVSNTVYMIHNPQILPPVTGLRQKVHRHPHFHFHFQTLAESPVRVRWCPFFPLFRVTKDRWADLSNEYYCRGKQFCRRVFTIGRRRWNTLATVGGGCVGWGIN
jgi:hypothetical protein